MQLFLSSIYIILYLYMQFVTVYCEEQLTVDETVSSDDELKKVHAFFYLSVDEDPPSDDSHIRKNEQLSTTIQSSGLKEPDLPNIQEVVFYKRLVTVLLSNLAMQKTDDKFVGSLSMEASPSEYEYLQNFVNGEGSIREVDRILGGIIKQPEYTACHYMVEASHYLHLSLDLLMHYVSIMRDHWDKTLMSLLVVASFIILRRQRWSRGLVIFLIIDVIFITSFFITWWRLIQEAEIKLMAAQAQFTEMPIACQPHKMNLWDKMIASMFSTNDCEKYYETLMTNPRLQVTPAFALSYFLTTTLFQPLSYFGVVISEFIDNATSKVNFLYKFPITVAFFLSFCVCIILVPFFLIGGSINLGFGPFFKFAIKGRTQTCQKQERIERVYEDTSPRKQLKDSDRIKQITFEETNDPAGGDITFDKAGLNKNHEKCTTESENIEQGDGDC